VTGLDGRRNGLKQSDAERVPGVMIVVYCLPMVLIAGVLIAAGGTRLGLLIPAITVGAMIGVMLFIGRIEGPSR
jgi:uncharacterized membrane protein